MTIELTTKQIGEALWELNLEDTIETLNLYAELWAENTYIYSDPMTQKTEWRKASANLKTLFRRLAKAFEPEDKKKEKVFYKHGDKFEHWNGIYRLQRLDVDLGLREAAQMALVKISAKPHSPCPVGYIWMTDDNRNVKDTTKITQLEFSRICSSRTELFTLIKE